MSGDKLREAMARLSALLRERAELGDLAAAVARDACDLIDAESCSVMLLDAERKVMSCYAAHGLTEAERRDIRFRVGEGIAGTAVAERRPVRVDDVTSDARFATRAQSLKIRSILAVPIIVRGEAIGSLSASHQLPAHFGDMEQTVLDLWAQAVGMDLESALLYRLSLTDSLTRVYNRRYLEEVVARRFERREPLAALFVDIDDFKAVNDHHGHDAGDAVLVEVAVRLRACVREEDIVLRYGGDEFLVMLHGNAATPSAAREVAARVTDRLKDTPFALAGALPLHLTGSVGVAADGTAASFTDMLKQVDRALYEAKARRHRGN